MSRLLSLLTLSMLLVAIRADDPDPEPDLSPEKVVAAFDKAVRDPKAQVADLNRKRKATVDRLRKYVADLAKRGKKAEATAASDCAVLLESIKPDAHLGKVSPGDLLKAASVKGKYRKLLHALHLPGDLASYTEFRDWGTWSGATYGGYTDLKPGYWVYVHPRWFIWEEMP